MSYARETLARRVRVASLLLARDMTTREVARRIFDGELRENEMSKARSDLRYLEKRRLVSRTIETNVNPLGRKSDTWYRLSGLVLWLGSHDVRA